uniref:Uncharacterized protein n=1 Tax=Thermococcus sp. EXT9 TaxID=1197732 RepID=L0B9P3_9EURY|nr:hypothetical protein e9a-6 [Thermococcus sp. EXT9]
MTSNMMQPPKKEWPRPIKVSSEGTVPPSNIYVLDDQLLKVTTPKATVVRLPRIADLRNWAHTIDGT